jgi:hypothetical protein
LKEKNGNDRVCKINYMWKGRALLMVINW